MFKDVYKRFRKFLHFWKLLEMF